MNTFRLNVPQGGGPIQVRCRKGVGGRLMYKGKQRQPTVIVGTVDRKTSKTPEPTVNLTEEVTFCGRRSNQ